MRYVFKSTLYWQHYSCNFSLKKTKKTKQNRIESLKEFVATRCPFSYKLGKQTNICKDEMKSNVAQNLFWIFRLF